MQKLERNIGKFATPDEVKEARHQTEKISQEIQSLLQNIGQQK
jgi:hypothetical protein